MEGEAGIDFPAFGQSAGTNKAWHLVVYVAGKGISHVKVRIPVLGSLVGWILRNIRQQSCLVVQGMTPCVGQLRR